MIAAPSIPDECCFKCRFARQEYDVLAPPLPLLAPEPADPLDSADVPWDPLLACHRHAPSPKVFDKRNGSDVTTEWAWPVVTGSRWCGEYQPRA